MRLIRAAQGSWKGTESERTRWKNNSADAQTRRSLSEASERPQVEAGMGDAGAEVRIYQHPEGVKTRTSSRFEGERSCRYHHGPLCVTGDGSAAAAAL